MKLAIGNKNYSSWSMRPWVLMRGLGLPFEEVMLRFDFSAGSPFRQAVAQISPAGMAFYTGDAFPAWRNNLIVGALSGQHVERISFGQGARIHRNGRTQLLIVGGDAHEILLDEV